jgi:hypothetical protein
MPECDYPGCELAGSKRFWHSAHGEYRNLCTIHARWDGTPAGDAKAGADACRAALRGDLDD